MDHYLPPLKTKLNRVIPVYRKKFEKKKKNSMPKRNLSKLQIVILPVGLVQGVNIQNGDTNIYR